MGNILGSWSGMRKYLEKDMLTPSLQGRVRYNCTKYVGTGDLHIFEVYIDGKKVKQFSWPTVNSYFIDNGYTENKNPFGVHEYWAEFRRLIVATPMNSRTEYTDEEFCEALKKYRNQSIEASLVSDNPIERMFAVLDRRVGKRTLLKLSESLEAQPEWLVPFYKLRLNAEA